MSSKREVAEQKLNALGLAKARLSEAKSDLAEARAEARQVFHLAQQPPGTPGAAEARQKLAEVEQRVPALEASIPTLQAAIHPTQQAARQAGLELLPEAVKVLEGLEQQLRAMQPAIAEYHQLVGILRECNAPLPDAGHGNPLREIGLLLDQIEAGIQFVDQQRVADEARKRQEKQGMRQKLAGMMGAA